VTRELELQEERARLAYAEVEAPPCPSCGRPVTDREWDTHRRVDHGLDQPRPYGRPESREALFVTEDREDLDRQIARWRARHPGLGLLYLADGRDPATRLPWVRFHVLGLNGRRAQ
jgi:hypothetical protein